MMQKKTLILTLALLVFGFTAAIAVPPHVEEGYDPGSYGIGGVGASDGEIYEPIAAVFTAGYGQGFNFNFGFVFPARKIGININNLYLYGDMNTNFNDLSAGLKPCYLFAIGSDAFFGVTAGLQTDWVNTFDSTTPTINYLMTAGGVFGGYKLHENGGVAIIVEYISQDIGNDANIEPYTQFTVGGYFNF
jgi:hypothetical protein